jgi:hypothetical protein
MKENYFYPLPLERLHRRYDLIFKSIREGHSVRLIGLPSTGRSSYFKFILENQDVTLEFTKGEKYIFLIIEPEDVLDSVAKTLILKLISLGEIKSDALIRNAIQVNDLVILQESILKCLINYSGPKIVFVIYEPEEILIKDKKGAQLLARVIDVGYSPPYNPFVLLAITSPVFEEMLGNATASPLRIFFEERRVFFPLFDEFEMGYLRRRLEQQLDIKISPKLDKEVRSVADGHTMLYRTLVNQKSNQGVFDFDKIGSLSKSIWNSLGIQSQKFITKKKYHKDPLLSKLNLINSDNTLKIQFQKLVSDFRDPSPQDLLLKKFFLSNTDVLIARDDVASQMWGEDWRSRYSDWALDQAIYSVKKVLPRNYTLKTIRNRGYIVHISN